jgi:hypothetical protein
VETTPIRGGFRFVGLSALGPTSGKHRGTCLQVRH